MHGSRVSEQSRHGWSPVHFVFLLSGSSARAHGQPRRVFRHEMRQPRNGGLTSCSDHRHASPGPVESDASAPRDEDSASGPPQSGPGLGSVDHQCPCFRASGAAAGSRMLQQLFRASGYVSDVMLGGMSRGAWEVVGCRKFFGESPIGDDPTRKKIGAGVHMNTLGMTPLTLCPHSATPSRCLFSSLDIFHTPVESPTKISA